MNETVSPGDPGILELVGMSDVLADNDGDAVLNFYGNAFSRFRTAFGHAGTLSRCLCFRSAIDERHSFHALLVENPGIRNVPLDMREWSFGEKELRISPSETPGSETRELRWLWRESLADGGIVGEFHADPYPGIFHLCGCAYCDFSRPADDNVEIVDYNPEWPHLFDEAAAALRHILPADAIGRVEHYGSTAIPGMAAKPVIDILVDVKSFELARQKILPIMIDPACEYWWHSGHIILIRRKVPGGVRTHHYHFAPASHPIWQGLDFRDHLRHNPEDAKAYAELKHRLAHTFAQDRERYTQAKTQFISDIHRRISGFA